MDNLCTPDGIEWIPEAMSKETLTLVTDGSYIRQLAPNVCGAGWIVQDNLTGKKVKGSLAEWSSSAGIYRGGGLGMLAVRVFLLAVWKNISCSTARLAKVTEYRATTKGR